MLVFATSWHFSVLGMTSWFCKVENEDLAFLYFYMLCLRTDVLVHIHPFHLTSNRIMEQLLAKTLFSDTLIEYLFTAKSYSVLWLYLHNFLFSQESVNSWFFLCLVFNDSTLSDLDRAVSFLPNRSNMSIARSVSILLERSGLLAPIWTNCRKAVILRILLDQVYSNLCIFVFVYVSYRFLREVFKKISHSDKRLVNFLWTNKLRSWMSLNFFALVFHVFLILIFLLFCLCTSLKTYFTEVLGNKNLSFNIWKKGPYFAHSC